MVARSFVLALWLVCLGGCALSPPLRPSQDPRVSYLRNLRPQPLVPLGLAIAPIRLAFEPELHAVRVETTGVAVHGDAALMHEGSSAPGFSVEADLRDLERQIAGTLAWARIFPRVTRLEPGDSMRAPLAQADEAGARLLLEIVLTSHRVRYRGSAGLIWWLNLINYFGVFPPFAWFVPDESFDVSLTAEATIYEVRSGEELYSQNFEALHEEWFNEFMHGWQILGFVRTPWSFSAENWLRVYEQLGPHALRKLELAIVENLKTTLPGVLEGDSVSRLVHEGNEQDSRCLALVVGGSGPCAVRDAQAIGDFFRGHGVRERDLVVLTGEQASRPGILAALQSFSGDRTLAVDRFCFYFSGFGGERAREGVAEGLLYPRAGPGVDTASLSLPELSNAMQEVVSQRVLFVLDASFGGQGGRTRAARAQPMDGDALAVLAVAERGWSVLTAAGPQQAALNLEDGEPGHGLLTYFLVSPRHGVEDGNADGAITIPEIFAHVGREVRPVAVSLSGTPQDPQLMGAPAGFFLDAQPGD